MPFYGVYLTSNHKTEPLGKERVKILLVEKGYS